MGKKRNPTPPPSKDEPKLYAVVQPYPPYSNCEREKDCINLARWIASCLGTAQPLLNIYHKPSAPLSMVIVAIRRDFNDEIIKTKFLGRHQWQKILQNPTEEDKDSSSRIFYSAYNSDRAAQKEGWKNITVEDTFFHQWSINNKQFVYPYPDTQWCETPVSSLDKPVWRPLPRASGPVTVRPPPAVPGSQAWASGKTPQDTNSVSAARRRKKKGKKPEVGDLPAVTIPTTRKPQQWTALAAASSTSPHIADVAPSLSNPVSPARPPGLPPLGLTSPVRRLWSDTSSEGSLEPLDEMFVSKVDVAPATPDDKHSDDTEPEIRESSAWDEVGYDPTPAPGQNLWANSSKTPKKKQPECPEHGNLCSKGICDVQQRKKRRDEQDAKRKTIQEARDQAGGKSDRISKSKPRGRVERQETGDPGMSNSSNTSTRRSSRDSKVPERSEQLVSEPPSSRASSVPPTDVEEEHDFNEELQVDEDFDPWDM